MGVRYVHAIELAPSQQLRRLQTENDAGQGLRKRERERLSDAFRSGYEQECLTGFDANTWVKSFGAQIHKIVLFCVEATPEACHRIVLAKRIAKDLDLTLENIVP